MRWFPDLANAAFCETVELRRKILERQLSRISSVRQGLEPSSAEFIAALAAGNNSQKILQVGCGISTVALAVAAQATGGLLVSIHTDVSKQDIVRYHMDYLGLLSSVEFLVASEPSNILLTRTNIDFAHFTGDPKDYIQLFDSLKLSYGAIVAADNVLTEASNKYIRHVRQQPGVESSTLPLAGGIEVTKLASWEKVKSGKILYSGLCEGVMKEGENRMHPTPCAQKETTMLTRLSGDEQSTITSNQTFSSLEEKASLGAPSIGSPNETYTSYDTHSSNLNFRVSPTSSVCDVISNSFASCSSDPSSDTERPFIKRNTTEDYSVSHNIMSPGSDGESTSECSSGFRVQFQNRSTETEVTITGANRDMLLSDITTAFSEMGISVKTANIETRDNLIEDRFYVIDAKSGAPLHPNRWKCVRESILGRIGKRCVSSQPTVEEGFHHSNVKGK